MVNTNDPDVLNILKHIDLDTLIEIQRDYLTMRFKPNATNTLPDLQGIRALFDQYRLQSGEAEFIKKLYAIESDVYFEIIKIICNYYNIEFNLNDNDKDLYLIAYWVQFIFVSNFTNSLYDLLTNFILEEKDNIYNSLGLNYIKNKDSAALYVKKTFNDYKLGLLSVNMDKVISLVSNVDMDINRLLRLVLKNHRPDYIQLSEYLSSLLLDKGDVFKAYYSTLLEDPRTRPDIITNMKMRMQVESGTTIAILKELI